MSVAIQNVVRSTQPLTNLTIYDASGRRARATVYSKRLGKVDFVFPDAPPIQVDFTELQARGEAYQTILAGLATFGAGDVNELIIVAIEVAKRAKDNDTEYFFF